MMNDKRKHLYIFKDERAQKRFFEEFVEKHDDIEKVLGHTKVITKDAENRFVSASFTDRVRGLRCDYLHIDDRLKTDKDLVGILVYQVLTRPELGRVEWI